MDFTADLPVVQIRRTVMRRALLSTAISPLVALAMGNEPLLLRYTIGLFGYGLIGCAVTDAASCLQRLAEQPYGLLVCSDSLESGDVLSLTATVKERYPSVKVIVISTGVAVDPALVRAAWIDGLVAECDMTFHSGALQRAVLKPAACRANGAATFSLGATGGTRTFLALSDGVAGFQAVNDAIVEISGFSGSLAALAIV